MRTDETPFYFTRVECPVCRTINEFETIKLGAYIETGRDTDFRPIKREWRNPRYQSTNPLLYFMASCTSCFYTREFNRRFREWKDDKAFRTHQQVLVRQKHLATLAGDSSPIKRLGAALWPASYPLQTAINKLLLGILSEQQLENPSHYDIARWYLRIGWLFREMGVEGNPHRSPWTLIREQVSQCLQALKSDIESASRWIVEAKSVLDNYPESVVAVPDYTEGPLWCDTAVQELAGHADALNAKADELLTLLAQDGGDTVKKDAGTEERYGDYPSYAFFLQELRQSWDAVPRTESEALADSLDHYRKAYREGRDIPEGNAQIQLTYMIGELARRIGQYQEAQLFLNQAVRTGREWIHKLKRDPTKTALARRIVDLAIEQLHSMRDSILSEE